MRIDEIFMQPYLIYLFMVSNSQRDDPKIHLLITLKSVLSLRGAIFASFTPPSLGIGLRLCKLAPPKPTVMSSCTWCCVYLK